MSVREKTKTLYSRNGIRIVKTENLQRSMRQNIYKKWYFEKTSRTEYLENIEIIKNSGEYIETKHESPLGFYYITKEWKKYEIKTPKSVIYRKYIIWLENSKYELEYPIKYQDNDMDQSINIEMRPWDILPGYTGMPDNMITALVKEANNFIDLLFEYKKSLEGLKLSPELQGKSIMKDLFGYEDGPKIQPNDIKILAHGFDLKESFRKRKEN